MDKSLPPSRGSVAPAACLALILGGAGATVGSAVAQEQTPAPAGNFFSSVKQAFKQDIDHDVVRGHFDVGPPPDAHRYYCMVDAKTGRHEANGVAGQPVQRPDGMTGIKGGAVSLYTCANAEQLGTLVTAGYVLNGAAAAALAAQAPAAPAPPAAPPSPLSGAPAAGPADGTVQTQVAAAFARFVAAQNARDRAALSDVLLDSKDFVWTPSDGNTVWGHTEALEGFQAGWKRGGRFEPEPGALRIASVAPGVAVLITRLSISQGDSSIAGDTAPVAARWGGVFQKTASGWRLASIFVTPISTAPAPQGR